ncbi:MAG: tetratricopeptide repeat protein [Polyangiaceae bacterium]
MPTRRQLRALALFACIVAAESPRAARADETTPANVAAARRHYDRARADYEQGAYREAIAELEAAHTLDPNAKDLVFNLAIVHEKLGDVDDALKWFYLYGTMSLTPQEQERADSYIRRLEGAKRELDRKQATQAPPTPAPPPPPTAKPERLPSVGRVDAATVTVAGVAGATLLFGVVLGAKAKQDQPGSTFVTGQDGSYTDLVNRTDLAHREAVIADVSFAISALSAAGAAYLFFSRPAVATRGAKISASPLARGGALRLEAAF